MFKTEDMIDLSNSSPSLPSFIDVVDGPTPNVPISQRRYDSMTKEEFDELGAEIGAEDAKPKKKPGRPKKLKITSPAQKEAEKEGKTQEDIEAEESKRFNFTKNDVPYAKSFSVTTKMLQSSIYQLDVLINESKADLDEIRKSSPNRKNKWADLASVGGVTTNMISTKINAIKELNATINNSHKLDMSRYKEVQAKVMDQESDDLKVANMYQAYLKMPVGDNPYPNLNVPKMQNVYANPDMYAPVNLLPNGQVPRTINDDPTYDEYLKNRTPGQYRMVLEANANIQTVVIYNREDGTMHFEVRDADGNPIPDAPVPEEFIRAGLEADLASHTAINKELNLSYPMIEIGNGPADGIATEDELKDF